MAATNTTLAAGEIAVHAITLTASTVDTVTFTDDVNKVEIISDGTADLYVRLDGVDPASPFKGSYRLPAGSPSVRELTMPNPGNTSTGQTVKLFSTGATKYSVTRLA